MTKSNIEKQYEKLIARHISSLDVCPDRRASLFLDFHRNSRTYYEELCDLLYVLSTGELFAPLWLNHSGLVYASTHPSGDHDIFLADFRELPAFCGDLVDHLDYVFSKIYSLSDSGQALPFCKTK